MCIRLHQILAAVTLAALNLIAAAATAAECPRPVGQWGHGPTRVVVTEHPFAYAANGGHIVIIDHTEPDASRILGAVRLTGVVWDLAIAGERLFAATGASGLQIIDVSNRLHPRVAGSVETLEAHRVVIDGSTAFVIDFQTDDMVTIDVTTAAEARESARRPIAWLDEADLAVADGIAYVAWSVYHVLGQFSDGGLAVFDVHDPSAPVEIARVEPHAPTHVNEVVIHEELLYIADGGIRIYDVADPLSPAELARYEGFWAGASAIALQLGIAAVDGGPYDPERRFYSLLDVSDPFSVEILGVVETPARSSQAAFLGDTLLIASDWHGLTPVDISDATSPIAGDPLSFDGAGAYALAATPDAAYVGTIARDSGLSVVDLTDPTLPTLVQLLPGTDPPQDLEVDGGRLYAAWDGLRVFDISDPHEPVGTGRSTVVEIDQLAVEGRTAVATSRGIDGWGGIDFVVYDVSDPSAPWLVGGIPLGGLQWDVVLVNGLAYVTGSEGLHIVDVSDRSHPRLLSTTRFSTFSAAAIAVYDRFAFLHLGFFDSGRIVVLDIADPSSPVEVGELSTPGYGTDLKIDDGRLLVANDEGFLVLDISSPSRPAFVGASRPWGFPRRIEAVGGMVLTTHGNGGVEILDLSSCRRPPMAGPPSVAVVD